MRHWTYWEWVAYAVMFVAAIIIALDQGIKLAPDLLASASGTISNPYWGFAPLSMLLLATLILIAREFGWLGKPEQPPQASDGDWVSPLTPVLNQNYKNETVELDGKNFIDCTFESVTFVYQGTRPVGMTNCRGIPPTGFLVSLRTDHPAVMTAFSILQTTGVTSPITVEHRDKAAIR